MANDLAAAYATWGADPTAENLNDLARATHAHALRFARRYSGLDADELAQQTTIAAWEHLGQYDPHRCSIAAWIATIAKFKAKDALRVKYREPGLDSLADEMDIAPPEEAQDINLRPMIRGGYTEDERRLMDAWAKDTPTDQLAAELKISKPALRKRQSRLRKKIIANRVTITL